MKSEQQERVIIEALDHPSKAEMLEGTPHQLQQEFNTYFDRVASTADDATRIEFVVDPDFLPSNMQRWQIAYPGHTLRDIRLVYPTMYRILKRPVRYSAEQHWRRVRDCAVTIHHCQAPFLLGWERRIFDKTVIALNRIEGCLGQSGFELGHLVASRISIALWFEGNCNTPPDPHDCTADNLICNGFPEHLVNLRYELIQQHPDLDVVLLFEDADIPLDQPTEMDLP